MMSELKECIETEDYVKSEGYRELEDEEVQKLYDDLMNKWQQFLLQSGQSLELGKDYFVHKRNVFEIIRRCDKRRDYYKHFHKLNSICEYKSVAIQCFWINSLKPFMVVNEESPIYNCPNEMFSLFLIMATIRDEYAEVYNDKEFEYPCPARIRDIAYDFKYCHMNREAMISFVETFADCYGVGINYILQSQSSE